MATPEEVAAALRHIQQAAALLSGEEPHADGPVPPDRFRWRGAEARDLGGKQWLLLDALCAAGRLRDAVPLGAVVAHVYRVSAGDERAVTKRLDALKKLRCRAQRALDLHAVPLLIDQTNNHLRLVSTGQAEGT